MAIVARRRKNRPRTPPMAYVEEVIPEGGLPSPPENLFMVPENWNPSTSFDSYSTRQPASNVFDPATDSTRRLTPPVSLKRKLLPSIPLMQRTQAELDTKTGHRKQRPPPARISWEATIQTSHLQPTGDASILFSR
jgi:hypothetical protein